MRTAIAASLIAIFVGPLAFCAVNEIAFLDGRILSFDKKTVRIAGAKSEIYLVPRAAIPQNYSLNTSTTIHAIPVYANQLNSIRWSSRYAKYFAHRPTLTAGKAAREPASATGSKRKHQ